MIPNNTNKIFFIPEEVSYLNCGYMAPLSENVIEAGQKGLFQKKLPYQIFTKDFFDPGEALRKEFAQLIKTKEPHRVAIIPSVSYGIANVTKNIKLKKGDKILLIGEQFPSNVYSWKRLAKKYDAKIITVKPPNFLKNRAEKWNQKILAAIDEKVKVVSMAQIHWTDGTLFDLETIRKKTKKQGALLIIDGTQSVGAYPVNVSKLKPDALICSGYKWLMGPYSIGLAYYGKYFDKGVPIEESWLNRAGSDNFADLANYTNSYQPKSLRYDVGEHSNFILVPMMKAALEQINEWGVKDIQAYCKALTEKPVNKLKEMGCFVENEKYRCNHMFGIRLPEKIDKEKLKKQLEINKVFLSFRGNAIRISPHIYNNTKDFDRLIACFKKSYK